MPRLDLLPKTYVDGDLGSAGQIKHLIIIVVNRLVCTEILGVKADRPRAVFRLLERLDQLLNRFGRRPRAGDHRWNRGDFVQRFVGVSPKRGISVRRLEWNLELFEIDQVCV